MSEHEIVGEGVHDCQPRVSESDLVAELLRDRLGTKLTEDELTSIIREVTMLRTVGDIVATSTNAAGKAGSSTPEAQKHTSQPDEDRVSMLKSSINYIEYKCREIERALRATDRHMRRERIFRDRSPLCPPSKCHPRCGLNQASTTHTSTRVGPDVHCSRKPWSDSYFS